MVNKQPLQTRPQCTPQPQQDPAKAHPEPAETRQAKQAKPPGAPVLYHQRYQPAWPGRSTAQTPRKKVAPDVGSANSFWFLSSPVRRQSRLELVDLGHSRRCRCLSSYSSGFLSSSSGILLVSFPGNFLSIFIAQASILT